MNARDLLAKKYPRVFAALPEQTSKNANHHWCACNFWATNRGSVYGHINKWTRLGETKHRLLSFEEQPMEAPWR